MSSYILRVGRKNRLSRRLQRRGKLSKYSDSFIIDLINTTKVSIAAQILGVKVQSLSEHIRRYNLHLRCFYYWRKRYLARLRQAELEKAAKL